MREHQTSADALRSESSANGLVCTEPSKIRAGLLPLYIEMYDSCFPELRGRLEPFLDRLAGMLEEEGLDLIRTPFCRTKAEFSEAVKRFETEGAECIVTVHMAYSPSLESAEALKTTPLPIVILDTTETFAFGPDGDPDDVNYNHGIHGVMDMCNLLKRNGKEFGIAAGHFSTSDVIVRTVRLARLAAASRRLDGMKVGVIGGSFDGMGDFEISAEELKSRFGVESVEGDFEELARIKSGVTECEIDAEIASDRDTYVFPEPVDEELYRRNVRECLTVRKWIEAHGLGAFSMNFLKILPENGMNSVPFLEACKQMARGIGYAGEGDALTACFAGAFSGAGLDASFCEIFCPDWKGNRLFLSHMGEMNDRVAAGVPEVCFKPFGFTAAEDTFAGYARFRAGSAVYANIARTAEGWSLILARVRMEDAPEDRFTRVIRGWMRPEMPVSEFLEKLSQQGATHHSVLVYDVSAEELAFFGRLCGLSVEIL